MDIVFTTVITTDKKWINKFKKYIKNYNPVRYNFNGEILVSLLYLQHNASWVRNIFIVTDNQTFNLDFLSKDFRNKIQFIFHTKIIPEEFLPTFNSTIIETFLWKIPGLSEDFLYLNDDFFILKPICKENFKNITYAKVDNDRYYTEVNNSEPWKYIDLNARNIFKKYYPNDKFYVSPFHTPFILNKYISAYIFNKTYNDLHKSLLYKKRKNELNGSVHFLLLCISLSIKIGYFKQVFPPKYMFFEILKKEDVNKVI